MNKPHAGINYESWTRATEPSRKVPIPDEEDEFSEYEMYGVPDWDGYGALPITLATVLAARKFKRLLSREVPPPDVAPGADGTIGFEWRSGSPSVCRFTLVDVGPGDLITARQVLENGSVRVLAEIELQVVFSRNTP